MKHYNPSITERANRIFNLKNGDGMSDEVEGPVAVIPVAPIIKVIGRSIAAGGVIYAAPADKDFYVVGLSLSIAKAAASTGSNISILATIDGVANTVLIDIRGITLTAASEHRSIALPFPIKIDRGTSITLSPTGNFDSMSGMVYGYHEEVTRT